MNIFCPLEKGGGRRPGDFTENQEDSSENNPYFNNPIPPTPLSQGGDNYYISFSKLSSLKRVARTVEAFREMPDRKLLVIYGENDPQKDEIMALAV